MTWRHERLDIGEQLAARLKQVRDEQPRPDPERLRETRELVLQEARKVRFFRTTQAILIATGVVIGAFALPSAFTASDHTGPHSAHRIVDGDDRLVATDPWVAAASRGPAFQADGWVPRGPST